MEEHEFKHICESCDHIKHLAWVAKQASEIVDSSDPPDNDALGTLSFCDYIISLLLPEIGDSFDISKNNDT